MLESWTIVLFNAHLYALKTLENVSPIPRRKPLQTTQVQEIEIR